MKTKIINISKIYSWNIDSQQIEVVKNKDILIENDIIIEISDQIDNFDKIYDAKGCILTPGFIDSHTHPIFIGNRSEEFILRLSGSTYEEISSSGGGINYSIKKLRESSDDELFESSYKNISPFINYGTTTIEAKSGYGLTLKDEIRSLEVVKKLNQELEIDIIPTFLGAHTFPPEYENKKDDYVDLICNEMIPEIAEKKLAIFCDVFCEEGYFSVKDSEKILSKAIEFNLIPRLHADEFIDSGSAELAGKMNAISADHLMSVNSEGIKSLSENNVIATLLPGTTFFLNMNNYANGRKLIDNNCEVALATDFNPGTCTIRSLSNIMFLSINYCGLSIDEAFKAVTYNAAKALKIHDKVGLIKEKYKADFIIWDIESINEIPYWFDASNTKIYKIFKKGKEINP